MADYFPSKTLPENNFPAADRMNLSFSGCGFLGIYHIGVASAIKEYMPHSLQQSCMAGCSAGALVAAALMCDCCLGQATTDTLKLVIQARSTPLGPLRPTFQLMQTVRNGLEEMLPANAHAICDKRLYISLTRFSDGTNVLVNRYSDNNELIQALICSAFIPFYCGTVPPTFRGVRYMDGGMSLNQPELPPVDVFGRPQRTIVVSPWSGESDICPADEDSGSWLGMNFSNTSFRFTARNLYRATVALFPPHPEVMSRMCQQGFEDALRYMAKNGLISCARCLVARSCIQVPADVDETTAEYSPAQFYVPGNETVASKTAPAPPGTNTANNVTMNVKAESSSQTIGSQTQTKTLKRMPPVALATRKRAATTGNLQLLRHHLFSDSDCDSCREMFTTEPGLPAIVSTKLAEAQQPKSGLVNYVFSLRAVRVMKYLALPYMLPLEFVYTVAMKLMKWLPSIADDARWFVERTTQGLRMLLSVLDQHRHHYSARFSCQLAVTELNYNSVNTGYNQSAGLKSNRSSVVCFQSMDRAHNMQSHDSCPSLQAAAASGLSPSSTYYDECEAHFAISAERTDALQRHLNRYVSQVHRDDDTNKMADATVNLQWAALNNQSALAAPSHQPISESPGDAPALDEDRDTVHAIVEYTRKHDSLMAYYYKDDDGQMTVTEIYGVDNKQHSHDTNHDAQSNGPNSNINESSLPSLMHKHRGSHPNIQLGGMAQSSGRHGSFRSSLDPSHVQRFRQKSSPTNSTKDNNNRRSASFEEPGTPQRSSSQQPSTGVNVRFTVGTVAQKLGGTVGNEAQPINEQQHLDIVNESNSDTDEEEDEDRFFVPRRAKRLTGGYEADTDH